MKMKLLSTLIFVSLAPSAFSMDEKQSIFVDLSPQVVSVKMVSESIIVTPLSDQMVVKFKASSDAGTHLFSIAQSQDNIVSPSLAAVRASTLQRLVPASPTRLKVRTDFTIDPFVSTESYHVIHNDGYLIAAQNHSYIKSTFGFENGGAAIKLNPKSQAAQQLQGGDPLVALFGNLLGAHLAPTQVYDVHKATVSPGCSVSSITARPFGGGQKEAFLDGTISYADTFAMNLSLCGAVLEFQPTKGFKFEILN